MTLTTPFLRFFSTLGMITALLAPATPSIAKPVALTHPPAPRLVVFLVVDGLAQRQVTGYQDQLAPDGFNRFLQRGISYSDAHYGQSHTVTAAGHSVMLTGAYPHRTGVIGDKWRDPVTGQSTYCTADAAHTYIGHPTAPLAGTSPKNLQAETVGDVLRRRVPASRVIAISGKDRGAILPAGQSGTAYMYMSGSGDFASSTYYMQTHPKWVDDFNAGKPTHAYFKRTWAPLLAESASPALPSQMARPGTERMGTATNCQPSLARAAMRQDRCLWQSDRNAIFWTRSRSTLPAPPFRARAPGDRRFAN